MSGRDGRSARLARGKGTLEHGEALVRLLANLIVPPQLGGDVPQVANGDIHGRDEIDIEFGLVVPAAERERNHITHRFTLEESLRDRRQTAAQKVNAGPRRGSDRCGD